jgi:uncharacterized protein YjbI with pentapeptide repeats
MQTLSCLVRRVIFAGACSIALAACALSDTPSAASTSSTTQDTTPDTAPETSTPNAEVPDTTVAESTTTTVVQEPEIDIKCITILKCQFSNLAAVDFSLLKLEFTDFSVANLAGAKFVGSNVHQAQFIRANLTGADFTNANLSGSNLTGATVSGANFTKANMTNTIICGLDLESVIGVSAEQLGTVQVFRAKGNRYCP